MHLGEPMYDHPSRAPAYTDEEHTFEVAPASLTALMCMSGRFAPSSSSLLCIWLTCKLQAVCFFDRERAALQMCDSCYQTNWKVMFMFVQHAQ